MSNHAYDEYYLDIEQRKLGIMFEMAFYQENLSVDEFAEIFINSKICEAFEDVNPKYVLGKSGHELLEIILNKYITQIEQNEFASPEYWVGWVLSYAQWYLNRKFADIIKAYPCSKILSNYFPYHEMDISKIISEIERALD